MPNIRVATQHDARALAQLAERTFRDTFGAANTAEDMALHASARYGESIQAAEIADRDMKTLVCEADDALIGFAQLRWKHAPACVIAEAPGEIERFYIDSAWHGKGIASLLMQACLSTLQAQGFDVVWLGVWERNPRAIAFYNKFGFVEAGEQVFKLGHDLQRDIIMTRPVVVNR